MRRLAWVVALGVTATVVAPPAARPAVAQPVTVPGPDFDHDVYDDLAVGVPGEDAGGQFLYQGTGGLG
jgi:hypothetical protein